MFLLNLYISYECLSILEKFTSHYVPIKSIASARITKAISSFTSHYVPIKSDKNAKNTTKGFKFTSHYVPIKSQLYNIATNLFTIYIPLCSY